MIESKHLDTLAARAALEGFELLAILRQADSWLFVLIGTGGAELETTDLVAVERFLDRQQSRRMLLEGGRSP